MDDNRRLQVAFILSVIVVLAVGVAQFTLVSSAQKKVGLATDTFYRSFIAARLQPGSPAGSSEAQDQANLRARQAELALTSNTMAILSMMTLAGACFAVAYQTENKLPSALIAAIGWAFAGATSAMVMARSMAQRTDLLKMAAPAGTAWREGYTGKAPFGIYLVLGLLAALLWQGFLPWLIGWFLGGKIGAWRRSSRDLGLSGAGTGVTPVQPAVVASPAGIPDTTGGVSAGDALPSRSVCRCGVTNLSTAAVCYACGSAMDVAGSLGAQGAQ